MRRLMIAAVLLAGCRSTRNAGSVPIEPALLSLVPQDTVAMAGVRFDVLKKTATWQKHFAGKTLPGLDRIAAQTGVNLREDVWQVLAISNGKSSVVMARGKFSEMGMEPDIKVEGAKRIPYNGHILIGKEDGAVTFINPTTAVLGKVDDVKYVLDQRNNASVPAALKPVLAMVPAGSQIWMVALGGPNASSLGIPQEGNLANLSKIYSSLQQVEGGFDFSSGVKIQGSGVSGTDEDARRLATALKGLIGLGRLNTPDNRPEMLRFWDAFQVEQKERSVTLRADIPDELIDKALAMLPALPQ